VAGFFVFVDRAQQAMINEWIGFAVLLSLQAFLTREAKSIDVFYAPSINYPSGPFAFVSVAPTMKLTRYPQPHFPVKGRS